MKKAKLYLHVSGDFIIYILKVIIMHSSKYSNNHVLVWQECKWTTNNHKIKSFCYLEISNAYSAKFNVIK